MDTLVRSGANTPVNNFAVPTTGGVAAKTTPQSGPHRLVDVAQFHNLPLAATPTVSALDDATLVNMDPLNKLLSQIETKGALLSKAVKGYRWSTDAIGPASWGLSAFLNVKLLLRTLKDPTITVPSKVALSIGTAANVVGAAFAVASSRFVGPLLHLATPGRIALNKMANMIGGIGGNIFSVINMVETLRNKDAKPAERFFAKLGFVLGMAGFVFGTTAMLCSMPAFAGLAARLPALLPLATKIANVVGVVGLFAWAGQLFLGKNKWISRHVQGTIAG